MAKMSRKSRSFLRERDNAVFLGAIKDFASAFKKVSKNDLIEYMYRNDFDDRAVFFAENLRIKTKKELEVLKRQIKKEFRNKGVNGVIELHIGADGTSKDAHIHYWGEYNEDIKKLIEKFIKENNLTNKYALEYTSDKFGNKHIDVNSFIDKIEVRDFKEKNEKKELKLSDFENETALENETKFEKEFYRKIEQVDEILNELECFYEDKNKDEITEIQVNDTDELNKLIKELEDFTNDDDQEENYYE